MVYGTMKKTLISFVLAKDRSKDEFHEIVDFIRNLNDCYFDRGLYFSLKLHDYTASGDAPDHDFAGSDLAFFLLDSQTGAEAECLYNAAADSYSKNSKPKTTAYIKVEANQSPKETEQVKDRSEWVTNQYASAYSHIDTVKLGILMQLNLSGLDGVDIRLENGKAWQNGEPLLALDNVEMVSGYEDLQRLKASRAQLEARYYAAKTKYAENPDDTDVYKEFFDAAGLRNRAVQEIRDVEAQLYHMIEGMYEQTERGKVSHRQVEGYRLMERGLLHEARMVLDYDAIMRDSRRDEEIAQQTAKRAQVHVNELMQLKDVNAALQDWEGVDECFSGAVNLEEVHNLTRAAMPAYVIYLHNQNMYMEAVAVAERLLVWYSNPSSDYQPVDKGKLLVMLGNLYAQIQRTEDAESKYNEALELFGKLAAAEPGRYSAEMASLFSALGNYYYLCSRAAEAEASLKSSIETWTTLMRQAPGLYELEAAKAYFFLGSVYFETSKLQDSAEMISTAIGIYSEVFDKDPNDDVRASLARCYAGIGYVLSYMHRASEAEEALNAASAHYEYLAERNPDAYEPRLAGITKNYNSLYRNSRQLEKEELSIKKGIEMFSKLVRRNPAAYERDLADAYNELGAFYTNSARLPEAEYMYSTALVILKRLDASDPGVREDLLALCYMNLGRDYTDTGRLDEADQYLNDALAIYQRLALDNPEVHAPFLAINLFYIAKLHKSRGQLKEAEEFVREAIAMLEKVVVENGNLAFDKFFCEAKEYQKNLYADEKPEGALSQFSPEEREVALLLTEGETQRDISRKLKITAVEVERLVKAIREKVSMGEYDPKVAAVEKKFELSRREVNILRCLMRDMSNAEIAAELFIAEETVRSHIHRLLKKLPVESRNGVAAWMETVKG